MIKVNDISEEYKYIKENKCDCGGEFGSIEQSLQFRDGVNVDVHKAFCNNCGANKEFVFDISSFFKPFKSFIKKEK